MENVKNCLSCKWEPNWSDWVEAEFKRRSGRCRYPIHDEILVLPSSMRIEEKIITHHLDNSGIYWNCECWTEKCV